MSDTTIRKNMVESIIKELRGPRYSSDEVIKFNPYLEYLSSVIIPKDLIFDFEKDVTVDNDILDETDYSQADDVSDDAEAYSSFTSSNLDPRAKPKSFGISFSVRDDCPKLNICATWGRYIQDFESTSAWDISGNVSVCDPYNEDIYKRYSYGEIFEIDFNKDYNDDDTVNREDTENEIRFTKILKNYDTERELTDKESKHEGFIKIFIKCFKKSEGLFISIFMINDLNFDSNEKLNPQICIFQPSIRIKCDKKIESEHIKMLNDSEKELDFLYRNNQSIAFGHMCAAVWEDIDYKNNFDKDVIWPDNKPTEESRTSYDEFLTPHIRTEFVPLYPMTLPKLDGNGVINNKDLNAGILANGSKTEVLKTLRKLPNVYKEWIKCNTNRLDDGDIKDFEEIARNIIDNEEFALSRIEKGIHLIEKEDLVFTAFCFANKVMDLQNNWDEDESVEFNWRPFQIAFFLMNIEDIFNEESPNREVLDLLWIPTGGGKTEAYLGIMAFTMALRRLKAYQNNESGAGTSIISRYTLRLLTVQQFRRTLKMVTAAEYLRVSKYNNEIGWRPKDSQIKGNWIYGSTRFSTGLWVGSAVSPLHLLKKNGGAMKILTGEAEEDINNGDPAQVIKCPVCGTWLSVPKTGLNDTKNNIHIVIKVKSKTQQSIKENLNVIFSEDNIIKFTGINSENHVRDYYTLSFVISGPITRSKFKDGVIDKLIEEGYEIASLGTYTLGYFTSLSEIENVHSENSIGNFDFEIWCTNPNCKLNHIEWDEGSPWKTSSKPNFADGYYSRKIESPFVKHTRMPIPAYLVDDHIYTRCPTIIISTADKIARLAYEPKAGAMFGDVHLYNKYYGYLRYHKKITLPINASLNTPKVSIKPFKAPDLIIQDELHLIDGPLGSLFGLYESVVDAIIKNNGGNPKYIASTATISNAKKQVDLLFSKEFYQFPPHGLDIYNNFFVQYDKIEDSWDPKKRGRLYLGLYTPGQSPQTPQVRLWSRILKTSSDIRNDENNQDSLISNYWTIVGYFNTIKTLGGTLSLYRDDIKNRLDIIDGFSGNRELSDNNKQELSSRLNSADLPSILDNLERDGHNKIPNLDAIFTTSMFGTGVDISHLGLMIMNSQPKTTGAYIQATGRIGRTNGGLIVDYLKVGRSRDLNHYEMFSSYHSRIYLDVESVSVSPFSKGALIRGLGPALVSYLRNSPNLEVNWIEDDGKKPLLNKDYKKDFNSFKELLDKRLSSIENVNLELKEEILGYYDNEVIKDWTNTLKEVGDRKLRFKEYFIDYPKSSVVLGDSAHENTNGLEVVYRNAPQSLRDVEDSIDFWV